MSEKITDSEMNRRTFLGRSALVAGAVVAAPLAASVAQAASKPTSAGGVGAAQQAAGESDFGVPLPADAAPKEYQFVQTSQPSTGLGWSAMDPLESIYSSFPGYNNLSEPLVRVDKDWQVQPGQATKWEVSEDGLSWTFDLLPGLK